MTRLQDVSLAWRDSVRAQYGVGTHDATLDSLTRLLAILQADHADFGLHLNEFGSRCGAAGHSLEDTAAWISLFAKKSRRRTRKRLTARPAAIELATGWMAGHNDLVAASTIDPFDVTALRVRLQQEYARLDAFGLGATDELSLVVLEAVFGDGAVPSAIIAAAARHEFSFGDTIAECPNGRVIVLTEHDHGVANLARSAAAKAARAAGAARGAVRAWIEPLARDPSMLNDFLSELTG